MHKSVNLCFAVIIAVSVTLAACAESHKAVYSDIKADEHVVFFRTAAWLDEKKAQWHVPIHGWIYEPEDSTTRKAVFSSVLKNQYDLAPNDKTQANFTRRVNLMIADNERDKQIVIALGGREYVLPRSKANGHFETTLEIPEDVVDKFAAGNILKYSAVTRASEKRVFSGEILLVGTAGLSIVSDIDDTVKISQVRDRKRLIEKTFLLDFSAVPGMAELYTGWSRRDVSLHFVSSSPWQLYTPLDEFLAENEFPTSTFSLKAVRFRDETLFNLFKEGTETKPAAIERILNTFSGRKFVLVGDSGEKDPEVYASLLRKYPDQIVKVYIRNVTQPADNKQRFSSVFDEIDKDCWELFDDPLALTLPSLAQ